MWELMRRLSFSDCMSDGVPRGCVPVLVGDGGAERFVVPVEALRHPSFAALLELAAQEFGYKQEGILRVPCAVHQFQQVLNAISKKESSTALPAAMVWEPRKLLSIDEVEVHIKILYNILCYTDAYFWEAKGQTPIFSRILGHEAGGYVIKKAKVRNKVIGQIGDAFLSYDRVTSEFKDADEAIVAKVTQQKN